LAPGEKPRFFGDPQIAGRFEELVPPGEMPGSYGRRDARRDAARHMLPALMEIADRVERCVTSAANKKKSRIAPAQW